MMILLLLHLWLAQQNVQPPNYKRGSCPPGYICAPDTTENQPAEHVIEIRTKRQTQPFILACEGRCTFCPDGYLPEELPPHPANIAPARMCERVTKTLYVDHVKIGVIAETEEK